MNRKSLLICAFLLGTQMLFAQDIIVTNEGESLKVYNMEIGPSSIFYQLSESSNAEIKRIAKSEVLIIRKTDGTKIDPNADAPSNSLNSNKSVSENMHGGLDSDMSDVNANQEAIREFNRIQQINYIGEKRTKDAKFIYGLFGLKSNSQIKDKNLEIVAKATREDQSDGELRVIRNATANYCSIVITIKNKSNVTIYLDLGNTFFLRNNVSTPYYVPSATNTTTGTTSGVGVNMGVVAGVLGIGGALGTLANGVNVGGSSSNSTGITTYSQRIIPVPPHSEKPLDLQLLFPQNMSKVYGPAFLHVKYHCLFCEFDKNEKLKVGEEREYNEYNSPICWGLMVTYSFDENITTPHHLAATYYTSKMIGCTRSLMNTLEGAIAKDQLPESYRDLVSFVALQ